MGKEVIVGKRDKQVYLKSIFYALSNFGEAHVKGLGHRTDKVFDIIDEVKGIDGIYVEKTERIKVKDSSGLLAIVKEGGGVSIEGEAIR